MNSILNPNLPLGEGVFDPEEVDHGILSLKKKPLRCLYTECPTLTLQGKGNISPLISKIMNNNVHENAVLIGISKSLVHFYGGIRYIKMSKAFWTYSTEHRKDGGESKNIDFKRRVHWGRGKDIVILYPP